MTPVLFDTSAIIAGGAGQDAQQAAISVVTLYELHAGVLAAPDESTRARRLATLTLTERHFESLPVDEGVAQRCATLVAAAHRRGRKPRLADSLIAATASAYRMTLRTGDRDFRAFAGDLDVEIIGG